MLIKEISERHQDWIDIVKTFGGGAYSEDIVQEMYLKIHNLDKEVNHSYVWLTLRSIFYDVTRVKSKVDEVSIGDKFQVYQELQEQGFEDAYEELTYRVNKEIKSWCHYDQKLFKLYTQTDMSLRDIHKGTNISLTSIFNTIKNCKARMKAAIGEDYEDLINGDYDKL